MGRQRAAMGEIMGESDNGGAWCQPRQGAFKALGRSSGGQVPKRQARCCARERAREGRWEGRNAAADPLVQCSISTRAP